MQKILGMQGNGITIFGMPWQRPGEHKVIGINSFTAWILCERHNSTLQPLDQEIETFLDTLIAFQIAIQRRSISQKHCVRLVSGEMLELWLLKLASGLFYSKTAATESGISLKDKYYLDEKLICDAFSKLSWANSACGLYIKPPNGETFPIISGLRVRPLIAPKADRVVGVGVAIAGLECEVIFDPAGVISIEDRQKEGWVYRPSSLLFQVDARAYSLILTWPSDISKIGIQMVYKRFGSARAAERCPVLRQAVRSMEGELPGLTPGGRVVCLQCTPNCRTNFVVNFLPSSVPKM